MSEVLPWTWRTVLKKGDEGLDVKAWQVQLVSGGYDLFPGGVSGLFDGATHNATISWQRERGLKPDGLVGKLTRGALSQPVTILAPPLDLPFIAFVEAKNWGRALPRRTSMDWIVLHSMEASEASTTAEAVSRWFAGRDAPMASAHFCVDSDSIVQCVLEEGIAYHAPGANGRGIGIEQAGFARQTRDQWLDPFSSSMMSLVAKLIAKKLMPKWQIPFTYCGVDALRRGERGITTHWDVTKAFKKSDHVDPGKNYPMDELFSRIQNERQAA